MEVNETRNWLLIFFFTQLCRLLLVSTKMWDKIWDTYDLTLP